VNHPNDNGHLISFDAGSESWRAARHLALFMVIVVAMGMFSTEKRLKKHIEAEKGDGIIEIEGGERMIGTPETKAVASEDGDEPS